MNRKMIVLVLFGICAVLSQAQQHDHSNHNHEDHRVNVTVYYESLCPDSIKFITKQLYPALQTNLSEHIELNLIPFGRASKSFEVNQFEFTCRHGPRECDANKIHACTLHLVQKRDDLGYNRIATSFINCLMEKTQRNGDDTVFPTRECATSTQINNLNEIENCANHPSGSNYLAEYGLQTESLSPPLKSVPTIVFDNKYKEDDNVLSQTNFVKAVCQYIHGDKPAECANNAAITTQISLITIVSLLVFNLAH